MAFIRWRHMFPDYQRTLIVLIRSIIEELQMNDDEFYLEMHYNDVTSSLLCVCVFVCVFLGVFSILLQTLAGFTEALLVKWSWCRYWGVQMRALPLVVFFFLFFVTLPQFNDILFFKIFTFRSFEDNTHLNSHVKEYSVKLRGFLRNQDKASF